MADTLSLEVDLAPGAKQQLVVRADEHPLPARLVVDTNVGSATVSIDGRVVARGSFDAPLGAGSHRVRVDADGYQRFERRLELAPGTTERLNVQLDEQSSGVLSTWWFWTGAAVLVAGSVTCCARSND